MYNMRNDASLAGTRTKDTISRVNSKSAGFKGINLQQSPKILTGMLRNESYNQMPFSHLDVPIGKFARGTKLPLQYQRKEFEKLFNNTSVDGFYTRNKVDDLEPIKARINFNTCEKRQNEEEKNSFFSEKKPSPELYKENDKFSQTNYFDKWMPSSFKGYERLVKTAHCQRDKSTNLPLVSVKERINKMGESDIFFVKKLEKASDNRKIVRENNQKIDYQDSDIFMTKNNKIALHKNSEKYLEGNGKKYIFNSSNCSNSEWQPKNSYPSLLNHSSTDYHILIPNAKHISRTKQQIISDSCNSYNPTYRQKSVCEFIDLTRVGVPNPNKEFLAAIKKSKNAFSKDSNICSTYMDLHRTYLGISERPFVKKIV